MDKKELIKKAIKYDAVCQVKKAMKRYGVEGTEEKIKDIYKHNPGIIDYLLKVYKEIITNNVIY